MVTITATLVTTAGSPPPVQIVIGDVPNGAEYVVTGNTGAGSSWPVPGGTGVGDGGQVVLVDNRSALNVPVTYSVVVQGVTYSAAPVTVAHDGNCALQSLDSQTIVPVKLHDNLDPRSLEVRAAAFSVPGRLRPPIRYATGGYGGGELQVTTTNEATAALRSLVLSGRPVLIRTDGSTPLENAVELILPTRADYAVGAVAEVYGDSRRWSIPFLFVDDPEPSRALSAWTWDDFDEAADVSFPTWDDFDDLFAGSTWNDFDTTEWGQYQ